MEQRPERASETESNTESGQQSKEDNSATMETLEEGTEGSITPTPTSAEKKSVKHLECAYYFSPGGCKFLNEEDCLYAHHQTGTRAAAPVVVEPGRPPVAGKNAERQHPSYNNWRNSAYEQGVQYSPGPGQRPLLSNSPASGDHSPGADPQGLRRGTTSLQGLGRGIAPHGLGRGISPQGLGRGTPSVDLRRQLHRIHEKAHSQQFQLPIRNAPANMGRTNLNANAAPFEGYKAYTGQSGPGTAMNSPLNAPMNSPEFSMPARHPHDVFGPQFGGAPTNYGNQQPGQFYMAGPPSGPPPEIIHQYEAALMQCQHQIEEQDRIIAQSQMEADQLRGELAATQAKLAEAKDDNKRLLKGNAITMDAYMHMEYHDFETMLEYRKHCSKDTKYLLGATTKLQNLAVQLKRGDATRKVVEEVRDMQLSVGKNFLVGGGNAADHQDEAIRLKGWMTAELAKSGNTEALQQYNSHHAGQGFTWTAKLLKDYP